VGKCSSLFGQGKSYTKTPEPAEARTNHGALYMGYPRIKFSNKVNGKALPIQWNGQQGKNEACLHFFGEVAGKAAIRFRIRMKIERNDPFPCKAGARKEGEQAQRVMRGMSRQGPSRLVRCARKRGRDPGG
jgi:hypothetical protein